MPLSLVSPGVSQAQQLPGLFYAQWSPFPDIISAATLTDIVLLSPELTITERWQVADKSLDESIGYYAWSPDGTCIAIMMRDARSPSGNSLILLDVAARRRLAKIVNVEPMFMEWSPNSYSLALLSRISRTYEILFVSREDGGIAHRWSPGIPVIETLVWNPVTPQIATITARGNVELWNITSFPPQPLAQLPQAYSEAGISYSPSGDMLVLNPLQNNSIGAKLAVYDTESLELLNTLVSSGSASDFLWGTHPFTTLSGTHINISNPDTGQVILTIPRGLNPPGELAHLPSWNPDNTAFVYNDVENGIHIRDGQTGDILARLAQS